MADAFSSTNPTRPGDPPDKAKGIAGCIGRGLSHAGSYPSILGVALFVLVLYGCFPCVFSLLASSFPVIICTTILLGILLSYGDQDIHNDGNREIEVRVGKRKEAKGKKARPKELKVGTGASDGRFDSSLGSPWQPIDRQGESSDSESDSSESSSPDASMMTTDIVSMIDELHPLLDTESPQLAFKSGDNSDATSDGSSQGSNDEEEQRENEEVDEDDAHEVKDDGNEEAVKWTADDQKNLMDLGTSEIERNRRLENLIARRSMKKSIVSELEGFLINLDVTAPAPSPSIDEPSQIQAPDPPISAVTRRSIDELSQIQAQVPLVSATRRNPFDVPCASEEMSGLPIIPGSAPSMIHPRPNPFDLPCNQADQSSNTAVGGPSNQVFVPVPPQDPFFRRHESFTLEDNLSEMGSSSKPTENMEDNFSERGSSSKPTKNTALSEGGPERLAFPSGGLPVASLNLSSIDEIESRSREFKELDVIQVGLPGVHEDDAKPIKLVTQRSPTSRMMHPSALSSTEAESSKDAD